MGDRDIIFYIELLLVFGGVIGFAAWEYWRTSKAIEKRKVDEQRERDDP